MRDTFRLLGNMQLSAQQRKIVRQHYRTVRKWKSREDARLITSMYAIGHEAGYSYGELDTVIRMIRSLAS